MYSTSILATNAAASRLVRCSARSDKFESFKRAFLNKDKTAKLNKMRKQSLDEIAVGIDHLMKNEIAEIRDIAKEHREFVEGEINEAKEEVKGWKILDKKDCCKDEDEDDDDEFFEAEVVRV